MREPGAALKRAYFAALDGNLTYNGTAVPVFDSKVEGEPNMYVLIATSNDTDRSNKSRFAVEKNVDLEVYNLRRSTAQSEVLGTIADQILQILLPTVSTVGFTIEAPFSVTFCKLDGAIVEGVQQIAENKFLHAKRITFRNRITQ